MNRIELHNFQAHKNLTLDLEKITSIVGPSDTGKSAIIRAVRWVALNKPSGESMIRHGAKRAAVSITLEGVNGETTVTRRRGAGVNAYHVNDTKLTAIGAGVPDEVKNTLRLGDINFQSQHDAPFWFADSAGQITRNLNRLAELEAADKALGYLNGQIRNAATKEAAYLNALVEAEERLKLYKDSERAGSELRQLQKLSEELRKCNARADAVDSTLEQNERAASNLKKAGVLKKVISDIQTKMNETNEAAERARATRKVLVSIKHLSKVQSAEIIAVSDSLYKKTQILSRVRDQQKDIIDAVKRRRNAEADFREDSSVLEELETELKETFKGRCPLCGNQMTEK